MSVSYPIICITQDTPVYLCIFAAAPPILLEGKEQDRVECMQQAPGQQMQGLDNPVILCSV